MTNGFNQPGQPGSEECESADYNGIPQADVRIAKDQRHQQRHQRQYGEYEAQLPEILEDHMKPDSVPEFGCLFSHQRLLPPRNSSSKAQLNFEAAS